MRIRGLLTVTALTVGAVATLGSSTGGSAVSGASVGTSAVSSTGGATTLGAASITPGTTPQAAYFPPSGILAPTPRIARSQRAAPPPPAPAPLPPGCDTDLLSAILSYLPVGTDVSLRMPVNISASGSIYKNEYGVLILSDESGNTPILIASPHICRIFTQDSALRSKVKSGGKNPTISLDKNGGA